MLGFEPIKLPLCFVCLRSVSCVRQCLCSSLIAPSVYLCVLFVFVLCLVPASVSVHPWLSLRFTFVFCLCSFCVLCPPVSLFILDCPFGLPLCFVCVRSVSCARQCLCSVYLCFVCVPWMPLRFTFVFCLFCVSVSVSLFILDCPFGSPLCFVSPVSCARQYLCSSLIAPSVYLYILFVFVLCLVPSVASVSVLCLVPSVASVSVLCLVPSVASVSGQPWLPLRFFFWFIYPATVPRQESERSCICVLGVMYLYVRCHVFMC